MRARAATLAGMINPAFILIPLVALAVSGCGPSEPAVAPTVIETVVAQAPIPAECQQAMVEAEALLLQSSQLTDAWQTYASVTMVNLLRGTVAQDAVLVEHDGLVKRQTALADALAASKYSALKRTCLAALGK